MVINKKVKGEIDYDDGEFAEIHNSGIEGIEEDLLLETFQSVQDRGTKHVRCFKLAENGPPRRQDFPHVYRSS
jgi:hypothetical protein